MTIQKVIKGKAIQFDSSDWALVDQYRLRVNPQTGYAMSFRYNRETGKCKTLYLARILMGITDRKIEVDHINRNKLDNRRSNLRIASHVQNCCNRISRLPEKYKGVMEITDRGAKRIIARVTHNKKVMYLGSFDTHELAAVAYNEAALRYHGEFAKLNVL